MRSLVIELRSLLFFEDTAGNRAISEDFVFVHRGTYVASVDAASQAEDFDHEVFFPIAYQLYDEHGRKVYHDYRGPGEIVSYGADRYLVTGDPYATVHMAQYRIDRDPTPDSEKALDDFVYGYMAGMKENGQEKAGASQPWLDGFKKARRLRKQ